MGCADDACTLPADRVPDRVEEWHALTSLATGRTPIDGGVRLDFGPDAPVADLAVLAQAEQGCCSFFSFALTVDGRGVGLEVRAPDTGAEILDALFGA